MSRSLFLPSGFYKVALVFLLGVGTGCTRPTTVSDTTNQSVAPPTTSTAENWLMINTKQQCLAVMRDREQTKLFPYIALGSSGAGIKRRRGDNITPLGQFKVGWIDTSSKFRIFIGLNYPNNDYADLALAENLINLPTYRQIVEALVKHSIPPQNTNLGGMIGIHGLGRGDPAIHRLVNWTDGCIALENSEIKELAKDVFLGMRVEIQ